MKHLIRSVAPGSVGAELGLEPGDAILSINGTEVEDILDYYFLTADDTFTLEIETKQGETVTCEVEKDSDEELGLGFADEFMGCYKHCANKCIFCFIDQLPKGMRDSLYFKDDDSRLSFLNGNYITMTNMAEKDFEKIVRYHMSPINVSVHTTNPELRVRMLKNPRAAEVMDRLRALAEAGIVLNGQIVLCKGVNDGAELDRTLSDLCALCPAMQSLSIVPVGLSDHREGLYPLEPFTKEDAEALIAQVAPYREAMYEKTGLHLVHLADEFYSLAGLMPPEADAYDGYLQIENGVGMMRLFIDEAREAIREAGEAIREAAGSADRTADSDARATSTDRASSPADKGGKLTLVTAPTAAPYIARIMAEVRPLIPSRELRLKVIENDFFGRRITVTGLLTGTDLIAQLSGEDLGDRVLLPGNMFRGEETLLLDDLTLEDVENALHTPCVVVKSSGREFVGALLA